MVDFEEWFEQRLPEGAFPQSMGALRNSFREIAYDSWEAACEYQKQTFNEGNIGDGFI